MFSWKRFWVGVFGSLGVMLMVPALIFGWVGVFWLSSYLFGPNPVYTIWGVFGIVGIGISIFMATDYGYNGGKPTNSTGPR